MGVSARILGREYGLTAQEMNKVLQKEGFLSGTPGNYTPTAKAMKYVQEKNYHRGCGGYDCYNRYWTERTYDPSILKELNITDELKTMIRKEIKEERLAKNLEREMASKQYYDTLNNTKNTLGTHSLDLKKVSNSNSKYYAIGGLIAGACIIGGIVVGIIAENRKKE